ncbi:hypothetical protein [Cellulophaga sp. L1A9]|uniref:hypothetical protein n=1 Tax=Cellulophaga sp. L1A9 TaxID=2686362 RepID=UPI00131C3FC7|nr:hypothetical protein [Cellulophaga sp. L1A9]
MELFNYYYTLVNKNTGEAIASNISTIALLKPFLSEALYEYLESESKTGKLNASRLEDDLTICIVKKAFESRAS